MGKSVKFRVNDESKKMTRVMLRRKGMPHPPKENSYDKAQDKANELTVKALLPHDKPQGEEAKKAHEVARDAHEDASKIAPTPVLQRVHVEMAMSHNKSARVSQQVLDAEKAEKDKKKADVKAQKDTAAVSSAADDYTSVKNKQDADKSAKNDPFNKKPKYMKPPVHDPGSGGQDLEPEDIGG